MPTITSKAVEGGENTTTVPLLKAAAIAVALHKLPTIESEFCRMGDTNRLWGIPRSTAYLLADRGVIKTITIRQKGKARGIRLVSVPSVRAYLNGLLEQQSADQVAA